MGKEGHAALFDEQSVLIKARGSQSVVLDQRRQQHLETAIIERKRNHCIKMRNIQSPPKSGPLGLGPSSLFQQALQGILRLSKV